MPDVARRMPGEPPYVGRTMASRRILPLLLIAAAVPGCEPGRPPAASPGTTVDGGPPPCGAGLAVDCRAGVAIACDADGSPGDRTDCGASGLACVIDVGCRRCAPFGVTCEDNVYRRCDADGTGYELQRSCDGAAGEWCSAAGCADLCALAEASKSYLGCEYWAVPTLNDPSVLPDPASDWSGFDFALVVANTQLVPARVEVAHPDHPAGPIEVAPGDVEVVRLPWLDALQFDRDATLEANWRSRLAPAGAYRVTSNVPVTVYQFNPLEFSKRTSAGGTAFSFTNDASLLLPTHVLTGDYRVAARATRLIERPDRDAPDDEFEVLRGAAPGFFTVVPVGEGATQVTLVAGGHAAGTGDGVLPDLAPGERATVSLGRGDVLQVLSADPGGCPGDAWTADPADDTGLLRYCAVGDAWDLTGTEIRADGPVAVLAGHQCAFVPFDRWACDHLEESQFPIQTWGREVLVPAPRALRGEPFLVRVLSATDGNRVTLDPPVAGARTLAAGGALEIVADRDLVVTAEEPVAVATYLVGQDWFGLGDAGGRAAGDPSMGFGIPRAQLRDRYAFLAPRTFQETWITVLAPPGAALTLDGVRLALDDATPVGGSGLVALRRPVQGGAHELVADALVALVVVAYAEYTSMMVPGGLDFEDLGILR